MMLPEPVKLFTMTSVALGLVGSLEAAEWETEAGLSPGLIYTDNVCLAPDNEQGEWIATVTPDIAATVQGGRAAGSLFASLQMNTLSDSRLEDLGCSRLDLGNRKQFQPRLLASGVAELVEHWLGLSGSASVTQNAVTPFLSGGQDDFNRTGNTNTTYSYALTPRLYHRFKDRAEVDISYSWDDQVNSSDQVGDSTSRYWQASLSSVPNTSQLNWRVSAERENVDYERAPGRAESNSELASIRGVLGYQVERSWGLQAVLGTERNDYVSVSDDIEGEFWQLGGRWTPNNRIEVSAGIGERFFGSSPYFDINYRHKRSVLFASYARDVTYDRNLRSVEDQPLVVGDQDVGTGTGDTPGLPGPGSVPTTVSNSPILDERFTLGYAFAGRRTDFTARLSQSEQKRASDGRDSTFRFASLGAQRWMASNLSLYGRLDWDEYLPRGGNQEYFDSERFSLGAGVNRRLTSHLKLNFEYAYTDRDSENPLSDYTENRVTLSVRYTF